MRDPLRIAGGVLTDTAIPTPSGISSANPIQPSRTIQEGTPSGSGTSAIICTAILGATMPIRRIGQARATTTIRESRIPSRLVV